MTDIKQGLKDVIALESDISRIDGQNGILEYRGYNIQNLTNCSFEEIAYLFWYKKLPTKEQLEEFSNDLKTRREIPQQVISLIKELPKTTHPMIVLRTAISYLSTLDKAKENLKKAKNILAAAPTITAYYYRIKNNQPIIHPNNNLDHSSNFLYMMFDKLPSDIERNAFNLDLVLHAEHTLNASTFSARITASTLSDIYSAIITAIGVLNGPLHGGAAQKVAEMLEEIKDKDLEQWVKNKLQNKEKIMGFGHRVYKVIDPRATELLKQAKQLDELKNNNLTQLSEKLAQIVKQQKDLDPNVDFYAASVYKNLEISPEFFTNIFAMSRIIGWTTHIMDQYNNNKIIRPLQKYIGETNKTFIPIEQRPT